MLAPSNVVPKVMGSAGVTMGHAETALGWDAVVDSASVPITAASRTMPARALANSAQAAVPRRSW